jgi:hypothetical protein
MKRTNTTLLLIVGSFLVYCAQDHLGGGHPGAGSGGSGMVPPAAGDPGSCCALPAPTTIFDQEFVPTFNGPDGGSGNGYCETPTFDISSYRDVVIHVDPKGCSSLNLQYRHGIAGFLSSGSDLCYNSLTTIAHADPHAGSQIRLITSSNVGSCNSLRMTIVGWK